MRQKSKAAKAAEYDALKTERDVYQRLATILFHNVSFDASEIVRDERYTDELYEYRLYDSMRANGGILVQLHYQDGEQSATVDARLFDDWVSEMQAAPYGGLLTEIKIACDRLNTWRTRHYQDKTATKDGFVYTK